MIENRFLIFAIILSLVLVPLITNAQSSNTSANFLRNSPDARGRALAQGGSVYSSGAISAYYNPANLVSSGIISVEGSYCKILPQLADDLSFKSIYVASNLGEWGTYGISYNYFDYGEFILQDENGINWQF